MDKLSPPQGLRRRILCNIEELELRRARVYVLASSVTLLLSAVSVLLSLRYLGQELSQSSFYNYFSLLFSDPDVAVSFWRQLGLSLVESAPIFGVTILLMAFAVLLVAIHVCANNSRGIFTPSLAIHH